MRKTAIRGTNIGINHRCVLPTHRLSFDCIFSAVAGNELQNKTFIQTKPVVTTSFIFAIKNNHMKILPSNLVAFVPVVRLHSVRYLPKEVEVTHLRMGTDLFQEAVAN